MASTVLCPICCKPVRPASINNHIDSNCQSFIEQSSPASTQVIDEKRGKHSSPASVSEKRSKTSFFTSTPSRNAAATSSAVQNLEAPGEQQRQAHNGEASVQDRHTGPNGESHDFHERRLRPERESQDLHDKRKRAEGESQVFHNTWKRTEGESPDRGRPTLSTAKRLKTQHAPLAERMRPSSLDEVAGQDLVGPDGVLRNLIMTDRVPSMILWGGPGTGKTTIARLLAETAGTRFVEINSTSSGVGECKKLFDEARNEQKLTGRKTIIFCDEIHRFSKSQQDVFLAPVEAGQIILVGATTENPSFKIVNALLSRCRTFTLSKLTSENIFAVLRRALQREVPDLLTPSSSPIPTDTGRSLTENNDSVLSPTLVSGRSLTEVNDSASSPALVSGSRPSPAQDHEDLSNPIHASISKSSPSHFDHRMPGPARVEDSKSSFSQHDVNDTKSHLTQINGSKVQKPKHLLADNDFELLRYLAEFADGDARSALNLLELALDISRKPSSTADSIKKSLTQTLVYDRAGDQHYDTISAFHKSVRGSDPDATLYYLARMLQSGEDPLYVARRMVVIASEDVGLADNSMLSLATATYSAAEKIGMPECRINLAHCAVALALAPKSVRAYRGLHAAYAALKQPGIAGLPIPIHLRNAPTRLMKELGYGQEYKYNPDYVDGQVAQEYLPDRLRDERFLGTLDFGEKADPDLQERNARSAEDSHEVLLGPDGD